MATRWLQSCLNDHVKCNSHSGSEFSPTRLVDISMLNSSGNPRLVQPQNPGEPYVALSHCWGLGGLPRTTLANLQERMQSICLEELSLTIREAISIVKTLGFRYLWIDALCIIQDSTEDWLAEASKMSSVFSGAAFTLAVADSVSHSEGIFRPREAQCIRPFRFERFRDGTNLDRGFYDGDREIYVFPFTKRAYQGARPKGPLDKRGWVLQEQILSPRILYYGRGELFWDCVTLSASESSPVCVSLLADSDPEETWALKLLRRTIVGASDPNVLRRRIHDAWNQVVKNYTARKLTKQGDKVIALEGILDSVAKILNDTPIAGMWRSGLWNQLLWWMEKPAEKMETLQNGSKYEAPSWSWLNADGPAFYHNSLHGDRSHEDAKPPDFTDLRPVVDIIDVHTETISREVGVRGTLTLTGPSFCYRIIANDFKKPIWKRWNQTKLKLNPGRWMLDDKIDLPLEVQCVVIAEDEVAKLLVCLCLVPVDDTDKEWKRVGVCHWEGLRHQISGYSGEEPVKRTFMVI